MHSYVKQKGTHIYVMKQLARRLRKFACEDLAMSHIIASYIYSCDAVFVNFHDVMFVSTYIVFNKKCPFI